MRPDLQVRAAEDLSLREPRGPRKRLIYRKKHARRVLHPGQVRDVVEEGLRLGARVEDQLLGLVDAAQSVLELGDTRTQYQNLLLQRG